jgi:hypothetical protein
MGHPIVERFGCGILGEAETLAAVVVTGRRVVNDDGVPDGTATPYPAPHRGGHRGLKQAMGNPRRDWVSVDDGVSRRRSRLTPGEPASGCRRL